MCVNGFSSLRHTASPYLIGTALRLADACDVIDAVVGSVALQAETTCLCTATSKSFKNKSLKHP